jgi:tetratricopeptide (TPR) repeat protein
LEPNEGRAIGALLTLETTYGNWFKAERDFRAGLAHHPDLPLLLDNVGLLLMDVGRSVAAVPYLSRMDRVRYLLPAADRHLILGLWSSGDLPGAEEALQQAIERWPQHGPIWRLRLQFLMHSGRPGEALALLDGPNRPPRISDEFVNIAKSTAKALLGTQSSTEAIKQNLQYLRSAPAAALLVAQRCAALGDGDTSFQLFGGYYFGAGRWASLAPPGGDQDRGAAPLFEPPMQPIWYDRRFAELLEKTGLENYWRESRTMPDFRRRV